MEFIHGISDQEIATQIANLLNSNNELATKRRPEDIFHASTQYVVETQGKVLVGACGLDKQSYTFSEVKHLVVNPQYRKRGIGKFLVIRALDLVPTPVVYASIREDNQGSLSLFRSLGFVPGTQYMSSEHKVVILTKVNEQWHKRKPSGHTSPPEKNWGMPLSGELGRLPLR